MSTTQTAQFLSEEQEHVLHHEQFPRSSNYDPQLVLTHNMGPNVLWLTEWLVQDMRLQSGMRILDLGCGTALSSLFLAYEFDVTVWATDLWIGATDNWQRIQEFGMQDKIFPIHAEAHQLPFARAYFDAILSVDSYQYYGTDQVYLGYLQKYLKPGGEIGLVMPGLHRDFDNGVPDYLTQVQQSGGRFWQWDCCTFHTADWWRQMWGQYDFMTLQHCEAMPDGGKVWLDWEQALDAWDGKKLFPSDREALQADNNRYITFVRLIANKNKQGIPNFFNVDYSVYDRQFDMGRPNDDL